MNLQFKLLSENATLPTRANPADAGLDLYAATDAALVIAKGGVRYTVTPEGASEIETGDNESFGYIEYATDVAVAIPEGFVGLIFPRSSVSKKDLSLANSVGVIDAGYRGPIGVRFRTDLDETTAKHRVDVLETKGYSFYEKGDRIAQLVVVPCLVLEPELVETLPDSVRGESGWGSSGS